MFPLSAIGSALFNFMMQVCVLVIGTFAFGKPPHVQRLGYAVLAVAIVLIYGTALAFVLSAVNVYLRDVQYIVEIMLMWGMWTAPVVYSWSLVSPHLYNPWVLSASTWPTRSPKSVLGFQRAFWVDGATKKATIDNLAGHMIVVAVVGLALLWICQRIFARLEANFAQEL